MPQAAVESVVRVDGRNAFIEATVSLENLGPDTSQVRVTLPPRTTLRAVRGAATLLARGGTEANPHVDVGIDRNPDGSASIELECERPIDPSNGSAFEAIGFTVAQVAAWRQWGRVSLVVEGDWRAEWGDVPTLRRVDPPPAARRPGFIAAFAYDSQPASLPVRVQPRRSRVVIEPEYRYEVGATRIGLLARLRVAARGAPVTGVTLAIDPAWGVDDVGPPGLVDTTAVMVEGGRVTIPFLQALAGDAVLDVRASRTIDRAESRLAWTLPQPTTETDSDSFLMPRHSSRPYSLHVSSITCNRSFEKFENETINISSSYFFNNSSREIPVTTLTPFILFNFIFLSSSKTIVGFQSRLFEVKIF